MPLRTERASTQVVPSVKVEGDDLLQEVEVKRTLSSLLLK